MAEIKVENLTDPRQAYPFLARERLYSAYAVGTLEAESWACCTALLARSGEEDSAFFLLAQPPETASTLFLMGEPAALQKIFEHPLARAAFAWISAKDEHLGCLKRYWRLEEPEEMLRMVVQRDDFRPPEKPPEVDLQRLGPADQSALAEIYDTAFGTPTAARLITRGPYYGVWNKGQLISVAGTHIVSRKFGLAAVGNVWTRPPYRGQGLATLASGAVTWELLETYQEVVLNVREDNLPARRVYERLGFKTHCHFWQMRGRWRS